MMVTERERAADPRGSRGAAAVEFALIVPILMLILLGIINYGFMLSDRQAVSQAAAEGARAAAVAQTDPETAGESAIQQALTTQNLSCAGGNTCNVTLAPCANATSESCATATVSIAYDPVIPFLGIAVPDTLSYEAVARAN